MVDLFGQELKIRYLLKTNKYLTNIVNIILSKFILCAILYITNCLRTILRKIPYLGKKLTRFKL